MPTVVILSVVNAECCNYVHYAESHYAECHYTECRGARKHTKKIVQDQKIILATENYSKSSFLKKGENVISSFTRHTFISISKYFGML